MGLDENYLNGNWVILKSGRRGETSETPDTKIQTKVSSISNSYIYEEVWLS